MLLTVTVVAGLAIAGMLAYVVARAVVASDAHRRATEGVAMVRVVFLQCRRGHDAIMPVNDPHGIVPERQFVEIRDVDCPACAVTDYHWQQQRIEPTAAKSASNRVAGARSATAR